MSNLIYRANTSVYSDQIQELSGNQKVIFKEMDHLLHKPLRTPLQAVDSPVILANEFADFFSKKVNKIRRELCACTPQPMPAYKMYLSQVFDISEFSSFCSVSQKCASVLISSSPSMTCALDAIPAHY